MNTDAWLFLGIVTGIGVPAVGVWLFRNLVHAVYPNESLLVIRFGRVAARLDAPGPHVVIDAMLPWVQTKRVSRRVQAALIPDVEVHDNGGTELRIDAFVEFRVVDPVKATFAIDDLEAAIANVVSHATIAVLGARPLVDILHDDGPLGDVVREETRAEVAAWGVEIEKVLWRQIRPSGVATEQLLGEAAARLEKAKARVEEEGRQAVSLLHARTSSEVAARVATARGQYLLAVGGAYRSIRSDRSVHEAWNELHDLTHLRADHTVAFRGFEAGEIRPGEVALLAPPDPAPNAPVAK